MLNYSIEELYNVLNGMITLERYAYNYVGFFNDAGEMAAFRVAYAILLYMLEYKTELCDYIFRDSLVYEDDFLEYSIEQAQEFTFPYGELLMGTSSSYDILYAKDIVDLSPDALVKQYPYPPSALEQIRKTVLEIMKSYEDEDEDERPCITCIKCVRLWNYDSITSSSAAGKTLISLCRQCVEHSAMMQDYFRDSEDFYILHFYTALSEHDCTEYMTSPSFFLSIHILDLFQKGVIQ